MFWLKRIALLSAVVAFTVGGVWRLWLANDVEDRLQAIRAAGLPISGPELDKYYAAVPDTENAARVMAQAFALVREYPEAEKKELLRLITPRRGTALTIEDKELLAGFVALNAAALAKAREACNLPKCRYPIDLNHGVETLLPHLAPLKALTSAAQHQAMLAMDSGNVASANVAIVDILKLGQTLDEEPCVISQYARLRMLVTASSTLERSLNAGTTSSAELRRLAQAFAVATAKTNLIFRALAGERAMYIPAFRMSYAEIERLGKRSENSDDSPSAPLPGVQPMIFQVTGFFERDLRYYLKVMEHGISLARISPPLCLAANATFEEARAEAQQHWYVLSGMLLPQLCRTVDREVAAIASVRLATTALALEEFRLVRGNSPESLNELAPQFLPSVPADPFDGKPLRYRRMAAGYIIYSVDRDLNDDGGRERPERTKSTDTNTYDRTFIVER